MRSLTILLVFLASCWENDKATVVVRNSDGKNNISVTVTPRATVPVEPTVILVPLVLPAPYPVTLEAAVQ